MRILDTGTRPGDDPDLVVRKRTAVATALVAGMASAGGRLSDPMAHGWYA